MKKAQFITFATERGFNFATAKARVQAYICGSTDLAVVLEDGVRNSRRVTFHITNKAAYAMRDRFNRWIAAEAARLAAVAATVADESEYAETVMAEEAEAEQMQIIVAGSVGVDNPFHPGDVVYVGRIDSMPATVDTLPKVGDVIEAYYWLDKTNVRVKVREVLNDMPPRPAHLQAARDAHHNELFSGFFNDRVKPTEARKIELEDMPDDQIYVVFAVVTAEEIEAAHAEALELNALRHVSKMTMPVLVEACHAEALAMNERHASAEPEAPAKGKRVTRVKLLSTVGLADGTNERTYRIDLDNGRTYFYSDRCQVLQVRHKSRKQANKLVEIKSPYILRRVQDAIARFQA